MVVFIAFLIIPVMINSVTSPVDYGSTVSAYATKYSSELAFTQSHSAVVPPRIPTRPSWPTP